MICTHISAHNPAEYENITTTHGHQTHHRKQTCHCAGIDREQYTPIDDCLALPETCATALQEEDECSRDEDVGDNGEDVDGAGEVGE